MDTFLEQFSEPADDSWTFPGHLSTNHLTHGYHRYPAKFVPLLVQKLIEEYTNKNDKIVDIFAGCGTTLVESKIHGRESIGVDVNPVAQLITKAKITPISPEKLTTSNLIIFDQIKEFNFSELYFSTKHERIDYWFRFEEKNKIAYLQRIIQLVDDDDLRIFYSCALSNILKTCSKWLQSSTKPQIDPKRNEDIPDPFEKFIIQVKRMTKKNLEFYEHLVEKEYLFTKCEIHNADARNTGIEENSIGAIITSPPYVTSYEYADIHQLTGYWFDFIKEISSFRKDFIGTFYSKNENKDVEPPIAKNIVSQLEEKSDKYAREIAKYFNDMFDVSKEMFRILKPGGTACLVIGNTKLKGVEITSAQAFMEMFLLSGFEMSKVIKRQITRKLIPTIRDKDTGKFTTLGDENKQEVYPEEYIIIAKKKYGFS
ncbi:MAG: site-specific DNA-methyltransferase [Pyrinomonadaceae bacterium]|nr:site-specific DNA-methyltransferase [Pyrinomonadaceae bacterium]